MSEAAIQFQAMGSRVYGILHRPEGAARGRGVMLISSGLRARRGPNRLYTRFSRALCEAGYHVLRFDPPGIGDSEGDFDSVADFKQRLLDDPRASVAALDAFCEVTGLKRFIVIGVCGGAYGALHAAAGDERVEHAVLAGMPVQHLAEGSEEDLTDFATQMYFQRLFSLQAWRRLLGGRSSYSTLRKALVRLATGKFKGVDVDERLLAAARRMVEAQRRILFVYGARDPLLPSFHASYWPKLKRSMRNGDCCGVHIVEHSNHDFSRVDWRDELIGRTIAWLEAAASSEGTVISAAAD